MDIQKMFEEIVNDIYPEEARQFGMQRIPFIYTMACQSVESEEELNTIKEEIAQIERRHVNRTMKEFEVNPDAYSVKDPTLIFHYLTDLSYDLAGMRLSTGNVLACAKYLACVFDILLEGYVSDEFRTRHSRLITNSIIDLQFAVGATESVSPRFKHILGK